MGLDNLVQIADQAFGLRGKTVVELGCADGRYTKQLAAIAKTVIALDARGENLASSANACKGLSNVTFRLCDVEIDPVPSADVIFHSGVLYHLSSPVKHLIEACSLARQGIILDTHFTDSCNAKLSFEGKSYDCLQRRERIHMPRAGMRSLSFWLRLEDILAILRERFSSVRDESIRTERHGPRCTIVAEGRRD